jgi:CRISPR-associated protein Cas2
MKHAVVHLIATDSHVHGYVSRFLHEVTSGLYVGSLSKRVADEMWERIVAATSAGQACMIVSATGEPGYELRFHNITHLEIRDFDGMKLPVRLHRTR